MTAAEKADKATLKIEQLHGAYLVALRRLNDSSDPSRKTRLPLIRDVWDTATALHNSVEKAIVQTDLLKLHESEFWATDLASTACNVLDTIPAFYTKMQKEYASIGQTCPKASSHAYFSMEAAARIYHSTDADRLQGIFEKNSLPIVGFTNPPNMNPRFSPAEKWTAIITGVVFCLIMLAIALWYTNFNNFNLWVFRIFTSLAVAILGGVLLPGTLNVRHGIGKAVIRATGSCGIFVLVFYLNPPALVINDTHTRVQPAALRP